MLVRTLGAAGVAAVAVGFAATAWADGMPQYSRVYAPAFSWTGFYIGANVGWERKHMVGSDFDLARNSDFNGQITDRFPDGGNSTSAPTSQNLQGWIGGGQIGYNHQFGRAVIGTELSGSWNDVSGSGDCFRQGFVGKGKPFSQDLVTDLLINPTFQNVSTRDCTERQKWTVNWLNKFGVTTGPLLVYLTGGVAVTEVEKRRSIDFRTNQIDPKTGATIALDFQRTAEWSGEATHIGVVLGAGAQYAIGHNMSLGVEYLRTTYASADYMTSGTGDFCAGGRECEGHDKFKFGANAVQSGYSDTIRAVLNYKFSADHERVPLK